MKFLKLCPVCRRKLLPRAKAVVGAWYCKHCDRAFSHAEVERHVGNAPGGVTRIGE
jgi:ribosomal protein L37AE/L43A